MDTQKTIYDFLIVAIPGLLLYFLGWAYLYFYLQLFSIDPSELKPDVQTVFIYSYTPFYNLIAGHWLLSALACIIIVLLIYTRWSLPRMATNSLGGIFRPVSSLPPIARIVSITFLLLVGILAVLSFVLNPVAKWAARDAANLRWSDDAPTMIVILNQENSSIRTNCFQNGRIILISAKIEARWCLCFRTIRLFSCCVGLLMIREAGGCMRLKRKKVSYQRGLFTREDKMYEKRLIAIPSALLLTVICSTSDALYAQDQKINGMTLMIVGGPYRFNSGGAPLFGYLVPAVPNDTPKTQKVSFVACITGAVIQVTFGELVHVNQPCDTKFSQPRPGLWAQWSVTSGRLVARQRDAKDLDKIKADFKDVDLKDIAISELPKDYQAVMGSEKPGGTAAITFASDRGNLTLGIVDKKGM
jgi:hypothetical protein